jgi:hypothetical protein
VPVYLTRQEAKQCAEKKRSRTKDDLVSLNGGTVIGNKHGIGRRFCHGGRLVQQLEQVIVK